MTKIKKKKEPKMYREYGVFPEPFNWSSHFSPCLREKNNSILEDLC